MIEEDLFKVGTVNNSFSEIATNDTTCSVIAASINDTQYCDKCGYKPFCGLCPVINYATSGSIICNIANSDWCKINKAQFDYVFNKLTDEKIKKLFNSWLEKEV